MKYDKFAWFIKSKRDEYKNLYFRLAIMETL